MRNTALIICLCLVVFASGCRKNTPSSAPLTDEQKSEQHREAAASEALAQAMLLRHDGEFLDPEGALVHLDEALAFDPTLTSARYLRAGILTTMSRTEDALADLDRIIREQPNHKQAHYTRGHIMLAKGNFREAAREFTAVIKADSTLADVYVRRGQAYFSLNRLDEAVDDYTSALALDPANLDANFGRGKAYKQLDELELALRDLNQAFVLDSENLKVIMARAQTAMDLGRFSKAAADLRRAISANPARPALHALLGKALRGADDMDGAANALRKAISLARSQGDESMAEAYREQLEEYLGVTYP